MALSIARCGSLPPRLEELLAGGALALAALLLAAGHAPLPVLAESLVAVAAGIGLRHGRASRVAVILLSVVLAHASLTLGLYALPLLPRFEAEVLALVLALAFGLSRAFGSAPSCRGAPRCG
jgi:hypothetical protein